MSVEANKRIARRIFENVFNQGEIPLLDELLAPEHIYNGPSAPSGLPDGPEGFKLVVTSYRTAFPDLHFTVDEQMVDGNIEMTRWTARGTHKGDLVGIPPTGKSCHVRGVTIHRFADGKIVESWGVFDQLGMLQQLGVIPSMGPS